MAVPGFPKLFTGIEQKRPMAGIPKTMIRCLIHYLPVSVTVIQRFALLSRDDKLYRQEGGRLATTS